MRRDSVEVLYFSRGKLEGLQADLRAGGYMGRTLTSPPRSPMTYVVLAALCFSLTSCLNGGDGGGGGTCETPFDTLVTPDEIKGNSQIYISLSKLDFMDSNNFVIDDVTLEATIGGKHKQDEDIALDMNGVKLSRRDGAPYCDKMEAHGNDSRSYHKVHKMYLNGGMSFEVFLLRLKLQHGTLRLSVNGKGTVVKDAMVRFIGRKFGKCPNPNPNPNPDPKPVAVTTIDSVTPSGSPTASSNISVAFSANQTGVKFWCSLDGAADTLCASPKTYTALANGSHTFKVYSENSSGIKETPPVAYTWTVDTVAPTVSITNAGTLPGLTNHTNISLTFASNEAASFQCSLDGGAYAACTSPSSYSALAEGAHNFSVRAVDNVGNVSGSPASFDWNIDLTNPITNILQVEPAAAISNVNSRHFEFAASESANFECSVDNGAYQACNSPVDVTGLSEGAHYFEVRALDLAGNQGVSVGVAWKNDYTAPQLAFGAVTPSAGLTSAKNLSAEFSSDEPAVLYCSKDGALAEECTSPAALTDVADGNHQLQVYAVDVAGNQSAVGTLNWIVDATAPDLSFASITPNRAAINSNSIAFEISVSETANLTMALNGSPVTASNPIELNSLSDGAYHFTVTATDSAGNVSGTISHDFIVDTAAPSFTVTSDDSNNPTNADIRTFTFAANENVTYECNVDSAGYGACESPLALSGLADGTHDMSVRATDDAGNATVVSELWTVDTRAPVTELSATQTGSTITFQFTADEVSTFECSLDGVTPVDCLAPITYNSVAAGNHNFTVWATDEAGNKDPAGASYAFTVVNPIHTSITSRTPAANLTNSTSVTFAFAADQATSGFICSLDGQATSACNTPKSYSGLSEGVHTFTVRAVDISGNVDPVGATSTWTVDTTAPVPNNIAPTATTNSITVTWTTGEGATHQLKYGVGATITSQTAESSTFVTSHSVTVTGLSSNTMYTIQVFGRDQAGNTYLSATRTVRTSR